MMAADVGNKNFPIWLLGDSNPERWQGELKTPFDPRHPVRHNIWTSILDVIQDISGGKFVESHNYFCGQEGANYFEFVGASISGKLLEHQSVLKVWVE
jgi:hypothetical protein